jgi:bifunctional DNase/RNase
VIEVKVSGLVVDNTNNQPVMFLKERAGERVLSIWIGPVEASAIAYALEGMKFQRPLTIDLMKRIVEGVNAKVAKVVITALKDDTFYASAVLETDGRVVSIDARPSDSVALALRTGAPIFVADEVMNTCATVLNQDDETKVKELKSYIKGIDPERFGDYSL